VRAVAIAWAATLLAACSVYSEDLVPPGSGGSGGTGGSGASSSGQGADGPGGAGGGATGGGGSDPDLGWPLDDSLPEPCPPNPPSAGTPWAGWGNLQYPPSVIVAAGQATEAIYGRTYRAGETPGPGQATGWEAELGVGPLGTLPDGEGRCWSYVPASFNVDVGNDDEYEASLAPTKPGLFAMYYRFRPPGGAWRYGDVDGSDDGIAVAQAGHLTVTPDDGATAPLVVVTLNLRCRLDDWAARKPLVVQALARVDPDLVAFQEDCVEAAGPSQADEIRAALSTYTARGYDARRVSTHEATSGNLTFDEGVSLLSAHPITASHSIDLPYALLPRKAIAADVTVRGQALRFYSTHFDFGTENADVRQQAAAAMVADFGSGPVIVGGDLNASPDEPAVATLTTALGDLWTAANPSDAGLTFPADAPARRIDYLFGTAAPSRGLLGAKILDETAGGTWLSDHRGVAAAFSFPR